MSPCQSRLLFVSSRQSVFMLPNGLSLLVEGKVIDYPAPYNRPGCGGDNITQLRQAHCTVYASRHSDTQHVHQSSDLCRQEYLSCLELSNQLIHTLKLLHCIILGYRKQCRIRSRISTKWTTSLSLISSNRMQQSPSPTMPDMCV